MELLVGPEKAEQLKAHLMISFTIGRSSNYLLFFFYLILTSCSIFRFALFLPSFWSLISHSFVTSFLCIAFLIFFSFFLSITRVHSLLLCVFVPHARFYYLSFPEAERVRFSAVNIPFMSQIHVP